MNSIGFHSEGKSLPRSHSPQFYNFPMGKHELFIFAVYYLHSQGYNYVLPHISQMKHAFTNKKNVMANFKTNRE